MKESTNTPEFLKRTGIASLVSGVIAGLCAAWIWGWHVGSGFVAGMLWSLGNIAVLAAILRTATDVNGIRKRRLVGWVALKLIVFYGAAVWMLVSHVVPVGAFAAGMGWPLLAGVLRAWTPRLSATRSGRRAIR